jgi:protein SCO1/2
MELSQPLPRPEFELTDTSGDPLDFREQTEGNVTLLYFGYTHCPDICPGHMADIAAALESEPSLEGDVKVVFVTVDPERDTAERLRLWLDLFDPSFIGLTGTPEEIDEAGAAALGAIWAPVQKAPYGDGEYTVSHPALVIAYGKDNVARTVYPFGTRKADYAHDLLLLVNGG